VTRSLPPRRTRRAGAAGLAVTGSLCLLVAATPSSAAAAGPTGAAPAATGHGFHHPLRIDNRFLPFRPGTKYVFDGQVDGTPHRVVLVVTDLAKVVDGVATAVLWDRDFDDGQLAEAELAFEAEDDRGTVWNYGEYPEEYEDGHFVGAPSTWIPGVDRARAGIHMLAHPRVGTPRYVQGSAPAIDFLDTAKVVATGQHLCVRGRCYDHVVVTDETSPLEPDSGHQVKYYAPRVGVVRIGAVGGTQQEFLDLVSVTHLGPAGLAAARAAALRLERRAYRVSKPYRQTPPMYVRR
jgi:hypothetical protein